MNENVGTYLFDIDSAESSVLCIYENYKGMSFSAMVMSADYDDIDAAKSAALVLAKKNEENYYLQINEETE